MNLDTKTKINKMETEPVLRLILKMAVPPLISMFMQFSYNLVDCMFVSGISEKALTAVSIVFPITTLMTAIAIWIGVGVNVLISNRLGQKNQNEANSVVVNGLMVAFIVGAMVTVCVRLIAQPFIRSFTTDSKTLQLALRYLKLYALAGIPCTVHLCIQKIIQGTGNMIAPMWFQIAGVVFNFIFDPIFIFGYFGFPKLGIRGAALASAGGFTVSMILAYYVLIFRKQKVQLVIKDFRPNLKIVRDIFVLGFPSFIMNALGAFMTYFTNGFLIAYSNTAVAFFGAYFKIQQVVIMTLNGLVQGCIPVMSYNYGAKKEQRLRESFIYGTRISIILTGASIVFLWAFPSQILKAFHASTNMMSFGVLALRIMCVSYVFAAITTMIASFMQATKNVGTSVILNLLRQLVLLIPCMWLFSHLWGMKGVWFSFLVAELITTVFSIILYRVKRLAI